MSLYATILLQPHPMTYTTLLINPSCVILLVQLPVDFLLWEHRHTFVKNTTHYMLEPEIDTPWSLQ